MRLVSRLRTTRLVSMKASLTEAPQTGVWMAWGVQIQLSGEIPARTWASSAGIMRLAVAGLEVPSPLGA
ncbi:MAG: hypothetical protein RLZZ214_1437 [Verrucomicrobiota bacterium]